MRIPAAIWFLSGFPLALFAHSGGLDKNGGHRDSKTGLYHYHTPQAPTSPVTGTRPTITSHPVSRTAQVGSQVSLAVSASGTATLRYQWEKNGAAISGATTNVFTVSSASTATAGQYRCTVSNSYGSATSNIATVTITAAPTTTPITPTNPSNPGGATTAPVTVAPAVQAPRIVGAPQSTTLARGNSATLSAQAAGTGLVYQWYRDGLPLLGATSTSYRIASAQDWMSGTYTVEATNTGGSVVSEGAEVDVGAYLLADDFVGPLDAAYWSSTAPFPDSRVTVSAVLVLRNRGRLLSRISTPRRYSIATRFRLVGSSYDQFSVYFRTSGATRNGSLDSGLSARFSVRSGDQGTVGADNVKIGTPTGEITGDFSLTMNRWYDVRIDDDGANVTVSIDGEPVVHYETSVSAGNLVGLQNREGSGGGSSISAESVTEVEYFRITSAEPAAPAPVPQSRVANLSTRGIVGFQGEPMIVGFVTAGNRAHRLLVRAAGPALSVFGVTNPLTNPSLRVLNEQGATVANNDDWSASATGSFISTAGAFPFPNGSRDAALVALFDPGAYTAQVNGTAGNVGVAIVEGYDLEPATQVVRLRNLSTRGVVGVNGENLSAGLVVSGDSPRLILVRAVGPSLRAFGVSEPLQDPVLTVYDSARRVVYQNDDWGTVPHAGYIADTADRSGAFTIARDTSDSAVLAYVSPAAYTFVVTSKSGGRGTALIEVYDVD